MDIFLFVLGYRFNYIMFEKKIQYVAGNVADFFDFSVPAPSQQNNNHSAIDSYLF